MAQVTYRLEVAPEPDEGGWVARFTDVADVVVRADTREEALRRLQSFALRAFARRLEQGEATGGDDVSVSFTVVAPPPAGEAVATPGATETWPGRPRRTTSGRLTPRIARPSVLVVDDDEDNRLIVRDLLEHEGYAVETASSARAALECLRRGPLPRCVLLDLVMPEMGGIAFCEELAADGALAALSIVAMSADGKELLRCREGIVRLRKPFDLDELLEAIDPFRG